MAAGAQAQRKSTIAYVIVSAVLLLFAFVLNGIAFLPDPLHYIIVAAVGFLSVGVFFFGVLGYGRGAPRERRGPKDDV